ncbi:hypothetical protein K3495_g15723, partial [Podosphaera aphanis]
DTTKSLTWVSQSKNKPRIAGWKTPQQIEKLRGENRCFRCERQGCYARICPFLPIGGVARVHDVPLPKETIRGPGGGILRAKWKTPERIDRLRTERRCFRCEFQGCNTRRCPLLPAVNPKFSKPTRSVPINDIHTADCQLTGMGTTPFLVNALLNDVSMVQALVDNGCLCSGVISDTLATKLHLERIPIRPRILETAENQTQNKPVVDAITSVSVDLDGFVIPNLRLYIVPGCTYSMILGKKWLEDQDAVIHARDQRLELRKQGISIKSVRSWCKNLASVAKPKAASVKVISEMLDTVPIFKVTLDDINKALRGKPSLSIDEAQKQLPDQVKDFASLFADDSGAASLPPHRGNLDHAIVLKKENGNAVSPPWGPLYSMSREELLVLRKTLTELLEKGWIRPSCSQAAAPVLFARKPNGG